MAGQLKDWIAGLIRSEATAPHWLTYPQPADGGPESTLVKDADYFRVRVVGNDGVPQTVFVRVASPADVGGTWTTRSVNLGAWAGQTIQLRFDALDLASSSLIEAGFDNVSITRQ